MTPELADKIMTRIIARIEADGGVLHKSSGIEEIIGACAVADAEGEIVESISDLQDGVWRRKDGTPFDTGNDRVDPWKVSKMYRQNPDALIDLMLQGMTVQRISLEDFKA